jgi:low temperature requirement protein LtrA
VKAGAGIEGRVAVDPAAVGDPRVEHGSRPEQRVKPLELFFDLVFVFAITQVTVLMADNPTWTGVGQGMLVLAAIWWAWGAYSWLTNEIDVDAVGARLAMLAAMGAMLVTALATPTAFGDDGVLFGCAYFAVRFLHILLFAAGTPDVGVRAAVRTLAETAIPGPALLILAGALDGTAQAAIWCLALAIDYGGPMVRGVEGFRVSPAHFAERYGLIMIIALGESIVAIGVGSAATIELNAGEVAAAALGIVLAGALWWTYFDVMAGLAERRLAAARGNARPRLARDAYSYLHLPMVAGIVLFALGAKTTLEHVGAPLETVPAVALCGGVALYLIAHLAFRLRIAGIVDRPRVPAALACLALIPLATSIDALAALAAVVAVVCGLVVYEAIRTREAREQVRAAA